eukprot:8230013-Prorocentrum_lima.AAC.1
MNTIKGMTRKGICKGSGDNVRSVQFDFPSSDVGILRKVPGMEDYDNTLEILDRLKAMWGLEDSPRAF